MKEYNSILLGVVIALVTTILALGVIYLIKFTSFSVGDFLYYIVTQKKTFIPIILSAGGNLAWFYFFLNRNWYKTTQGIVLVLFLLIIAVILIKFVL